MAAIRSVRDLLKIRSVASAHGCHSTCHSGLLIICVHVLDGTHDNNGQIT